jgi:uncharacterized protein (DUF488 family)
MRRRVRRRAAPGTVPMMHASPHETEVFTIGHSTRSLDELVALLRAHGIACVVDIRSVPRSRRNPQFDTTALRRDLRARGLAYRHEPRLGGFRRPSRDSVNTGLTHPSFRAYADHMQTEAFQEALDDLVSEAGRRPIAVMCAEGDPFRCHRRLLADVLTARGVRVLHITSAGAPRLHELSSLAVWDGSRLTYPAAPEPEGLTLFG